MTIHHRRRAALPAEPTYTATVKPAKSELSAAEYAVSLLVLFGGWMVALFGIAGHVRPAGMMTFAVTGAAGVAFVAFSWFIYGSNIQTLMWVADLMEDRVLRTRENWKNETLRSLVEVGSWLHITFRIYTISESALVAAFCGAVVGAFCVVLGDLFTEYTRKAEQRIVAQAETGYVGYRYLRRLSCDSALPAGSPAAATTPRRAALSEVDLATSPSTAAAAPTISPPPAGEAQRKPSDPHEEFASVFYTPQFATLVISFVLAATLHYVQDSQDLGLAVILTALTNVAFITAEQVLMLWRPTRWAAIILHDRVMNVIYNWQHETIRSGFETCFYLSSIFSCYALCENVPVAVLVGTLSGMSVVLISSWSGIGGANTPRLAAAQARGERLEIFMLAIFGWACATLLYTIFVFSRNSVLAIFLAVPTSVALMCVAELAASNKKAPLRAAASALCARVTWPLRGGVASGTHPSVAVGPAGAPGSPHERAGGASKPLKTKLSVLQFALGSLLIPSEDTRGRRALAEVSFDDVLGADEDLGTELDAVRRKLARKADSRVVQREELAGNEWVVIEGFVIDVAAFSAKHPGGEALLRDYASRQADVSDQFAAFHHPVVYNRLLPLVVGRLAAPAAPAAPVSASEDYRKLRAYLWRKGYFAGAECDFESARSCAHQHLVVLSLAVLAVCQVALLGRNLDEEAPGASALAPLRRYVQCVLAAVTMGFFWQQVAFIAHDALHNGVVNRTKEGRPTTAWVPNNVLGWFHGSVCFGISSAMWLDEHSVHHALTMRPCQDAQFNYLPLWCVSLKEFATTFWADMRASAPFMPRFTALLISVQHWTLLPLAVLVGRFNFYIVNIIYAAKHRVFFDLLGMAIFWVTYLGLVSRLAADWRLQLCFVLVSHWTVGVLHVQLLINHLATDAFHAEEEDKLEFFSHQIRTTRNIDSTVNTDWFHGGLQYQIEHHLFPQLPRHRLALVKPAVQQICQRNALTYDTVPFFRAVQLALLDFRRIADEVWAGNLAA